MSDLRELTDIAVSDGTAWGGKAGRLAALARHGLPVPPAFVVPSDVLEEAARSADLDLTGDPGSVAEALTRLPLSGDLVRALRRRVAALGKVAVRSSAAGEDGGAASHAGQYATVLGVDADGIGDAVRAVWASWFRGGARAYRASTGEDERPAMAVLVQQMVEPLVSGVLFTVNPVSGSWREMVVEAVWGLGEPLVSGRVAPHWYLVRRPRRVPGPVLRLLSRVRLELVQQDTPPLTEREVMGPDGGTRIEPLPEALRGQATLTGGALRRVCRLGLRIEALLGEPQDVEWAMDARGRVFLLQARPITRAGPGRAGEEVLWTRRFIGERWPGLASPLGWSMLAPLLSWFIAYPETQARLLGGGPALRLVRSRPYVNATVFRHLAFKLPGAPPPGFMIELLPPAEELAWRSRFAAPPDTAVYASILRETFAERRWRRFAWNPFTNADRWDAFQRQLADDLPWLGRPVAEPEEALRLVEVQLERVRDYVAIHITSLLFANLFYQLLDGALASWAPDVSVRWMEVLATSPPGNLTLATHRALDALASEATEADLAVLEAGEPMRPAFSAALERFLEGYGHRASASWEIFAPRWGRHPAELVPLLRARGGSFGTQRGVDPEEDVRQVLAAVDARLPGPRGRTLHLLVHYTRRYLLLRENQRFWFERLLSAVQGTLLGVGAALVSRGTLAHEEDVALLTWSEVRDAVHDALEGETAAERVTRRRAERERDLADEPPTFLLGDDQVVQQLGGQRLQGLGISAGRARGRVRVLRSLADGQRLQSGEVLVARAVDPAWTALFAVAGAVVLEMGSVLSHGAVVAREYGVPTVVNLDQVTTRLRDGQEVTVDGTRGVVWLHP